MMTSYTLNNWDGGASNTQPNQQVSNQIYEAGNETHSNWNADRSHVGGLDALDVQDIASGGPDTYAIFGTPNKTDFVLNPHITESTITIPQIPIFGDVSVSLPDNTDSNSGTRTTDVNDASNADMEVIQERTFVPIPTSALHSPTARKNASGRAPTPFLTLLEAVATGSATAMPSLVPDSPTPAARGLALGQEKELDDMSMYTSDASGEDEGDDVVVVENLQDFSPSKTALPSDTHADDFQSQLSHNAYSPATPNSHHALQKHESLFTPPPSDDWPPSSVGTGRSSCPPADRPFTPEPAPSSHRLTIRIPPAVTTLHPRPFPPSVPDIKGKGKEKATAKIKPRKRRTIMAYVQVPPLKRPRSAYVKFGISGSSSSAAGVIVVKNKKAILGPPPSAAGPSSASRPPFSSAGFTFVTRTGKPGPLSAKFKKKSTLSATTPKPSHDRSFSLGDALQASFSHNERVGTLSPGLVSASGSESSRKDKRKDKGKERAWALDELGQRNAVAGPSRIRAGGGFPVGAGARPRPPISVRSTSTTSGSVLVVGTGLIGSRHLNNKKRPLKDVDADADDDMNTSSKAKAKRPRIDIDLTISTSDEEREQARKRRAAVLRREEEEEEVEIVEVKSVNPKPGPKQSSMSGRPPNSSASVSMRSPPSSTSMRPPMSSASMRPPLSSASMRPPLSSASARPPPSSSHPSSFSKGKTKVVDSTSPPKLRPAYAAMTPSNSNSKPPLKGKPVSSVKEKPGSFHQSQPSSSTEKENAHQNQKPANRIRVPKLKPRLKAGAIYDARHDIVRLVLGDLTTIGGDVMGSNLRGLKGEVGIGVDSGQGGKEGLAASLIKDVQKEEKGRNGSGAVQAPWACPPPRSPPVSKSHSGLPDGAEGDEEISVGGPVLLGESSTSIAGSGKAEAEEEDFQVTVKRKAKKKKAKASEPASLFSAEEDEDDDDEEDGKSDVESELRRETNSDDIPLSRGVASGEHQLQQLPQAPLKKIDLAARFRKNTSMNKSTGKVKRSAPALSLQAKAAAAAASSPLTASTRGRQHASHPQSHSQSHPHPPLSAPLVATSSLMSVSMAMSTSPTPAFTLNHRQQHADVDEYITSAPLMPSAKALGKRRALSPGFSYSHAHHDQAALLTSASSPPPPYTPPVLQHAFLPMSSPAAGTNLSGPSINVNVNATINHHHHHSYLHGHDPSQQHLLRDPNGDLDVFLVSPIRSAVSVRTLDLGVGESGSRGLYSHNLHLRDEAVMLGGTQSDLAHLYSPPGLPAVVHREEEGKGERLLSETVLDSLVLDGVHQPQEDPWATLTDSDGQYTYSTINPALIGGGDVDMLSGHSLFSEEEEEEEIKADKVVVGSGMEVDDMDVNVDIRGGSPAFSSSPPPSARASKSLSVSATRLRPPSEVEVQKSPSPIISSSPEAAPNGSEEDEYLASDVEVKTIPKKRKRKHDPSFEGLTSAFVAATAEEDAAAAKNISAKRSTTTPGSEFSNVPLAGHERSRRKHIPRRMDDMILTSGFSLKRGWRAGSEYTPTSASFAGSGGEEGAKSDSEGSEINSVDRVVVVKKKKLQSVSSSSGLTGLSKASVRAGPWPTTSTESYCHQCRTKSSKLKTRCTCGKEFCVRCFTIRYPDEEFDSTLRVLDCPACQQYCNCTACCKKRGEVYVPSAKQPPGNRIALGGKTNQLSVPVPAPAPTPVPVLNGPIPETAKYWGSIYSLTTGERLTSTFVTPDMGLDVASGAPTVVYAPASAAAAAPSPRPKKSKMMAKGRVFVGVVQRSWGLGRHPNTRVIDPFKLSSSVRGKRDGGRKLERRFYVGNPSFLKYCRPEPEDPYSYLLESLSPLTSLDDSSDEEPDGAGHEAGMA